MYCICISYYYTTCIGSRYYNKLCQQCSLYRKYRHCHSQCCERGYFTLYLFMERGGGTNLTTTSLTAGIYIITASDNTGCTASASATITEPASSLSITINSVSNATCFGNTGTATANAAGGGTAPYTYSWRNGGGTNLTSASLPAGIYIITVTDNHACSASASATITQPASVPGITINSVNNVACFGGTGTAIANSATGVLHLIPTHGVMEAVLTLPLLRSLLELIQLLLQIITTVVFRFLLPLLNRHLPLV